MRLLSTLCACVAALTFPLATKHASVAVKTLDSTDQTVDIFYPKDGSQKYNLLVYMHGYSGGSWYEPLAYYEVFSGLASYGYVVVSPRACNYGCKDHKGTLPGDPEGFEFYYEQQLKAVDWALAEAAQPSAAEALQRVNPNGPVGVIGHSMGGQATLFSSSRIGTDSPIKSAVLHHAYTHQFEAPIVPFLVMTGSVDTTAPPEPMATGIFNQTGGSAVRGYVNKKGADHTEPIFFENKKLALFSAAWFKLTLPPGVASEGGVDFHNLILGADKSSLCNGGDGDMVACTIQNLAEWFTAESEVVV